MFKLGRNVLPDLPRIARLRALATPRRQGFLLCLLLLLPFGLAAADVVFTVGGELTASPIRPLLGVNAGPTRAGDASNPDFTSIYQQAGVTMIRTHDFYGPMDMPVIYPDQNADPNNASSYHFEESDAVFRGIVNGGFEPFLRIGDSYNNVRTVTNRANWAKAAVQIVRRYTDTTLWGTSRVRYVEIYNEPDNPTFWRGTQSEFYQLYAETAKALKSAFPNLKIGGPGFAPSASMAPAAQPWSRDFVSYMKTNGVPLDFLSWHIYSDSPAQFATVTDYYRNLLDTNGFTSAESVVTEFNSQDTERSGNPATRTGAQGAALMTAGWIVLQQKGIAASTFYRGQDTSIKLPTFYGLWLADGTPKPVGLAFTLWTRMTKFTNRLDVTATGTGAANLYILAGRDSAGSRAFLIANPTANATSWQIAQAGGIPAGYVVRLQQVSTASSAIQSSTLTSLAAELPAWGTQLVTIEPASATPAARIFSAASFAEQRLAANSLATIYGSSLATATGVVVKDAAGVERSATIIFKSANQINLILPATMALGDATFTVVAPPNVLAAGTLTVAKVAPGLFSLTSDGQGIAAANVVRYHNAVAHVEAIAQYNATAGQWSAVPVDLTPVNDRVFLFLYGTGIRGGAQVTVTVGGVDVPVSYAGAQAEYPGLDQVNIELPRSLTGRGTVPIVLTADGVASNSVNVAIR